MKMTNGFFSYRAENNKVRGTLGPAQPLEWQCRARKECGLWGQVVTLLQGPVPSCKVGGRAATAVGREIS